MAHPHAALMAEYAKDAAECDKPWELWEYLSRAGWCDLTCSPSWSTGDAYRRKLKTIRIGEFDVPEPLLVAPGPGKVTQYWAATLTSTGDSAGFIWNDDCWDKLRLARGLIHLTQEAAELHAKALLSFTEVKP